MAQEKMWALLVHLSMNFCWGWRRKGNGEELPFDDKYWEEILKNSVDAGINTIVMDLGDGVKYATHPEISLPTAWSRKRVRQEVKRCKDMGITLIPKLNFSKGHDEWIGEEYHRMTSTPTYYRMTNDLIHEVYDLFEKPEYIHLGMDEEDARHVAGRPLAIFRQKELYWNDLNYFLDSAADTGAKPWIWSCPLFRSTEGYQANVGVDDAVISPWYYHGIKKEHYQPITCWQDYIDYYSKEPYKSMNLTYVEEDPYNTMCRSKMLPLLADGYKYIPTVSAFYNHEYNALDLMEYFRDNAKDEQILGYMTAPWAEMLPTENSKVKFEKTFRWFKEAKEKIYG